MTSTKGRYKTGGRKKGTPNRRTGQLADQLEALGLDVPGEIVKAMPGLDAEARIGVLMELMTFLFPKRKALEMSGQSTAGNPQIVITLPSNGREALGTPT